MTFRFNDTVMVGDVPVVLGNHFYNLIHLPEELREPDETVWSRHNAAMSEVLGKFMSKGGVYAFRPPVFVQMKGVVLCRTHVIDGIAFRHLVDWDHQRLQTRSIVDVFAGRVDAPHD